ncbi:countin-like protein [Actinia tenebrosa]|uniref:Countin-like protein n=1 Tax=Actinia tenebrosa TaxID=6105 RepID=A0A6P8HXW9_ACTTE|nr:countin-like protein [Actinia tenebrosa]
MKNAVFVIYILLVANYASGGGVLPPSPQATTSAVTSTPTPTPSASSTPTPTASSTPTPTSSFSPTPASPGVASRSVTSSTHSTTASK